MASTLIVDQIQKTGGSTTALTLPTSNASASQYLQNDGAGALSWATVASSGYVKRTFYPSGSGTGGYSPDSGVTKIVVELLGAGGAGSRYSTDGPKVNGGGAGGYVIKTYTVTSSDTMTISIGGAGTHTGNTNEAGGSGGSTTFQSATGTSIPILTAGGGGGGSISNYTPGTSGTATGGDFNLIGDPGRTMNVGTSRGGNSPYGYGGSARTNEATGLAANGIGYGTGGGGGADNGYAGNGAAGLCVITEYK